MASSQRTIDREGAPAPLIASSFRRRTSTVLAVGLSLFTLVEVSTFLLEPLRQLALFFSFALALTFLLYPLFPHASSRLFLVFDLLLASLSSAVGIYITLDYWDLIFRVGMPTRLDLAMSVIAVLLVLEATRRTLGKPLVIINGIFLLYVFYGHLLPLPLSHGGYDLERVATTLPDSKWNLDALTVMFDYIYLFIIFGTVYVLFQEGRSSSSI
jgi:TRAP-type uncharacterized transport system fused permease subunit